MLSLLVWKVKRGFNMRSYTLYFDSWNYGKRPRVHTRKVLVLAVGLHAAIAANQRPNEALSMAWLNV